MNVSESQLADMIQQDALALSNAHPRTPGVNPDALGDALHSHPPSETGGSDRGQGRRDRISRPPSTSIPGGMGHLPTSDDMKDYAIAISAAQQRGEPVPNMEQFFASRPAPSISDAERQRRQNADAIAAEILEAQRQRRLQAQQSPPGGQYAPPSMYQGDPAAAAGFVSGAPVGGVGRTRPSSPTQGGFAQPRSQGTGARSAQPYARFASPDPGGPQYTGYMPGDPYQQRSFQNVGQGATAQGVGHAAPAIQVNTFAAMSRHMYPEVDPSVYEGLSVTMAPLKDFGLTKHGIDSDKQAMVKLHRLFAIYGIDQDTGRQSFFLEALGYYLLLNPSSIYGLAGGGEFLNRGAGELVMALGPTEWRSFLSNSIVARKLLTRILYDEKHNVEGDAREIFSRMRDTYQVAAAAPLHECYGFLPENLRSPAGMKIFKEQRQRRIDEANDQRRQDDIHERRRQGWGTPG